MKNFGFFSHPFSSEVKMIKISSALSFEVVISQPGLDNILEFTGFLGFLIKTEQPLIFQ